MLTQRLCELERRLDELQRQILIEKSKTVVEVKESEIRKYYIQALQLEPQMLITYLVKQIVLFDDKVQIQFNSPISISPDNSQGFSFYAEQVNISYKVPQRQNPTKISLTIEIQI